MVLHDWECSCSKNKTFEANIPLKDNHKKPKCPKCKSSKNVKKVIVTAFPKMQSWRTF